MALDKLVDSTQLDSNLTSVANAIRAKSGGTGQLAFPAGFVSEIGNISGGGGITPTGTKEITITENGTTTEDVTNYAAAQITVNVPSSGGTVDWSGLVKGTWPTGSVVLDSTVTTIPQYRLKNFSGITSLNAVGVTTVETYALEGLINAEQVILPVATKLDAQALSRVGQKTADGCVIVLKAVTTLGADCIRGSATKVKVVDFSESLASIPNRCFYQGHFGHVIFRKTDDIVTMSSTNAIGVGASGGFDTSTTVFVPSVLISAYEENTNWSTAKSSKGFTFAPIEGSVYENKWADGSPLV